MAVQREVARRARGLRSSRPRRSWSLGSRRSRGARRRASAAARGARPHRRKGGTTARESRLTAAGMSPRANARGPADAEARGRALAPAPRCVRRRPELEQRPVRLLEVVADDLLVLAGAIPRLDLDPGRESLVQLGPQRLRELAVGGVSDEDVREAKGVVPAGSREVGPDQLLAHQRLQMAADPGAKLLRAPAPTTAPHQKTRPTTDARSITVRSSGSSRSSRAASSAWIVGGIAIVDRSPARPSLR